MPSPSQDTVACTCPSCGNLFAVKASSAYSAPHTPLAPKKKTDKRTISVHGPTTPGPNKSTTKIRKRKEGNAAPAIAAPRCAALAPEEPEYRAAAADTMRSERRPTWHIWLFVAGLVLSLLGVFMFLRGRDMEAENSKLLNISDRFVDHEALFSQEVNKDLLEQLQQRERQYLIAHSRREEDRKAESISPHITAAMNELALYCMAESDEERLNYVMNPAAVAPKMAYWASYGQYKDYLPQEAGRSSKNGDLLQISVLMDDNTIRPAVFLYDRNSGKWKLDWEAWEGYSPMLPAELEAKKPSTPVPVRIILSMSGIYQPPFLEESSAESYRNTSYLNFTLEFPNGERLNAYVDRYSPLALELTRLLYNGPVRTCVLIRYPEDLPGNRAVIIDQLLHSGWMSDATRRLLPTNN